MVENLHLVQSTDYPFDGTIRFTAKDVKVNAPVHLRLRVPDGQQAVPLRALVQTAN